ncbi:cell division FtsA domain-containing protein [Thermoanaerobacterium thermosaccharolyticum]|uniref:cell division protein FtsA n=1 Tax=Thermoanaerobacterium TaxID=28895 RepID=UPI0026DF3CE8|nr:cell division FtsA domain-containing protein [Thermoanaerobacterium sp. CMT5567-10]WHE06392.1 cell division FtsA domain-containing protein [Thermoanaerobacterium thermosaccharolyticum]WKV08149.1 cell division FtsA domain-containing protein [Thermoanaerobacterium sp. CMT5567-10]
MNDNLIFSLDIGTRVVVGIVGVAENDKLKILAVEQMEHSDRVMFDGQIHDIEKVSSVACKIKEKLEKKLGVSLKNVSLAAAGRSLKTKIVRVEKSIDENYIIKDSDIDNLVLSALNTAKEEISHEGYTVKYHMVGYSITSFYLDGLPITNLKDHTGREISVEIIATFLPYDVVESLYSVAKKADLNVTYLTLEPIAAIGVAIMPQIRMLNIALIDIGAGTSDIAISKEGNIIAYSMVPFAGDEVTETIQQHFLTDFNTAEKIKTTSKKEVKFKDVIGIEHKVSRTDVLKIIEPVVKNLSKKICDEILKYNGKSPSAVFLVGGSSNLPNIAEEIAKNLSIPLERVSVRDASSINVVEYKSKKLKGPEYITPIGIAYSSMIDRKKDFITIYFNDEKLELLNVKEMTIMDVLLKTNFDSKKLIARPGKNLSFTLNGKNIVIDGEVGTPAKILKNGIASNLKSKVENGDKIVVVSGINGKDASITVKELKDKYGASKITVNGSIVDDDYIVKNGDDVKIIVENQEEFFVYINGDKTILTGKEQYIFIDIFNFIDFQMPKNKIPEMILNGRKASYTDILKKGDKIEIIV